MLDAAQHSIEEGRLEQASDIIARALERHRETIRELKDLSFALEPVILRDQGFAPALRALAAQVGEAHSLRIDVSTSGAEDLGETAQVALYTIIRELIDQSVRRGPPTKITVTVEQTTRGVEVVVTDDADPERRRSSFEAVEERVRQVHGDIDVVVGNGGTDVRVTLPSYTAER
jgi:signal transduction histidine kinase